MSNPFERFDIDPMQGPAAITERMRELLEDADESERDELRAVWEELTMHPRRRFQVALDAFPETRVPLPEPSSRPQLPRFEAAVELRLRDLVVVPLVAQALGEAHDARPALLPSLAADPFISDPE